MKANIAYIRYFLDKDNYKITKNKIKVINKSLQLFKNQLLVLIKEVKEGNTECLKDKRVKEGLLAYKKIYGDDDTVRKLWGGIWNKLNHINTKQLNDFVSKNVIK